MQRRAHALAGLEGWVLGDPWSGDCEGLLRPAGPISAYPALVEWFNHYCRIEEACQWAASRLFPTKAWTTSPLRAKQPVVLTVSSLAALAYNGTEWLDHRTSLVTRRVETMTCLSNAW